MGDHKLAAVGVFALGGFLLFAVGLFMIGDRRQLFDESFEVYAEFDRVAGVQNGAKVRVAGVDAGEVVHITYPSSPASKFRVRMRVVSELRPLVRTDSVATIQTDGLVGSKVIEIQVGSEEAPGARDGDAIQGQEPFELQDLMARAAGTVTLLDTTIEDLRGDLDRTLESLAGTMEEAESLLETTGRDVAHVTATTAEITSDVQAMVRDVRSGSGTLGKLVTDDALYEQSRDIAEGVQRITDHAANAAENIEALTENAKKTLAGLEDGGQPAGGMMTDVSATLAAAREAMGDMAENMESLKRSFFFRGMFLERGFFDIDELTLPEYLDGALRDRHHRTLRIWIPANELFDKDDAGRDVISERGKARISAVLRRILRYPQTTPLIVEGYASIGSVDEQYRSARGRAVAVRDYIVNEYHRNPNYTGFMAMEDIEPDAAGVDGGDGVIVALFYDNDAVPAPRNRVQ